MKMWNKIKMMLLRASVGLVEIQRRKEDLEKKGCPLSPQDENMRTMLTVKLHTLTEVLNELHGTKHDYPYWLKEARDEADRNHS